MSVSPPAHSAPFVLDLQGESLHVERVLRELPGKRLVCAGRWRDRDVVAKIYSDPRRHAIHAQREAAGADALQKNGSTAPRLLHRLAESDRDVLIFERIHPAQSALERWEQSENEDAQYEMLRALVLTTAAMHDGGILQEDLHLGNFIFSDGVLYVLDAASIRSERGIVAFATSIDNLGLLFAQLPPRYDRYADALYAEYARVREWPVRPGDGAELQAAIARRRARRRDDYLRKVFRGSTAFASHKDAKLYWVCDRGDDSPAMRAFLADPDAALRDAHNLKSGNTASVDLVDIDGKKLIVKRYKLKSASHALQRAVQETRAANSWRNAHRLRFYGLPTPRPVALVEKRWGPLRRVSYFITEYAEGIGSRRYFLDDVAPEADQAEVMDALVALLEAMWAKGIVHGDTKGSNFLVSGKQVSIIDLDSMTQPRSAAAAAEGVREDRARFLRNWPERPSVGAAFAARLAASDGKSR